MEIKLYITPPTLLPWLPRAERECSAFLLDVRADLVMPDRLRIDLDLVFCPIVVRHGMINKVDYFIGSTGADAYIEATDGEIGLHTSGQKLTGEHTNKIARARSATLTLSPEVKSKTTVGERSVKPGEIRLGAENQDECTVKFTCSEMVLAPVIIRDRVWWRLDTPRGEPAVRDFLVGNLALSAECIWFDRPRTGRFGARADIRFFNDQRRPLAKITSLLMQYRLWRIDKTPMHANGFDLVFEEVVE
jgi:hypothetical protein